MKKVILLLGLFFMNSYLYSYTFINSVPSGAEVTIDNVSAGTTPLVIKEKLSKKSTIIFKKTGYHPSSMTFSPQSSVTNLYSILTPDTFSLYFPDKNAVVINNRSYDNEEIRNIPSGYYHFKTENDAIYMDRVNPNRKYLIFSLVTTGIGLATGLVAHYTGNTAFDAYQNNTNASQVFSLLEQAKFLDILSWTGYGLAGLGGGFSLYFGIDALRYKQKNQSIEIKGQDQAQDYQIYNLAMDQLSQEKTEDSLKNFSTIIEKYKDSKFVPVSLFRRSVLLQKQGKYKEAIQDLLLVKVKYPIYEIYETAVKYLADNYVMDQNYEAALQNYQDIRNIHENYSINDIDLSIIQTQYKKALSQQADTSTIKKDLRAYIMRTDLTQVLKAKAEQFLQEINQ